MDPQEIRALRKLVERTLAKVEDTNDIVHSMRASMRWSRFFKIAYWGILLASALGAYYYLQPFLGGFGDFFGTLGKGLHVIENVSDSGSFGSLFGE